MREQILLIGLNHQSAPVEVRERFSLAEHCSTENWAISRSASISESLILSTCNRVEVLCVGCGKFREEMLAAWTSARKAELPELLPYIYSYEGLDAVRHLFAVASSLDSMVLGEPQILGQLKHAYRMAVETGNSGVILNRMLHKAFSVAKRVRSETAVASSAVSISYAAVELAKRIFDDMPIRRALLMGAGEMAELAALHLIQAGIAEITVANRTLARAEELAARFGGRAIPFADFTAELSKVDIVISSTGADETILGAEEMRSLLKVRRNRPIFLIDIAVPRDIDPAVNALDNVYLYDIDDLREVVEENQANRQGEAAKAREIVEEELARFAQWLKGLELTPTIVSLLEHGERVARSEVARTLKRLGPGSAETRTALEIMAKALTAKLYHAPLTYLKDGVKNNGDPTARISLIQRIFDLNPAHGEENQSAESKSES